MSTNGHTITAPPAALSALPAITSNAPADLLRLAIERNLDIDKLKQLTDWYERIEKIDALKAFNSAMAAFKAQAPAILRNKHIAFAGKNGGTVEYDYATLDRVCELLVPILSKHGLSHSWRTEQRREEGRSWIKVTCLITHERGHSESCALYGLPDDTGSKNPIQAIGSTVFYLQRYTFMAIVGMAAGGIDTDANPVAVSSSAPELLPPAANEACAKIAAARTRNELQAAFRAAYTEASKKNDEAAKKLLIAAKDRRLRELR